MTPLTRKLFRATRQGDINQVEQLLERGADIHATNHAGDTPLHVAVTERDANVARVLLKAGADINAVNHAGDTPLHVLVPFLEDEIARVLLEAGADPNVPNAAGDTPLLTALETSNRAIPTEVLLDHGANPNAPNDAGTTPLHMVARHFDDEAASLLLRSFALPAAQPVHPVCPTGE